MTGLGRKPSSEISKTAQTTKKQWLRRIPLRSPKLWVMLFLIGLLIPFSSEIWSVVWDSEQLTMTLQGLGMWASLIFIGLHILATAMGIPGVILTMAGGICFGLFWGSLWSLVGATLGAIAAFGLARYWMHGWFQRNCSKHPLLKSLNRMVTERPFWFMLTLRFAPISPFNVLNFLLGLTQISLKPYAVGTFLGIIPGVIIYTWFGQAGYMALHGKGWLSLILAGSALAALSAIPLFLRNRIKTT